MRKVSIVVFATVLFSATWSCSNGHSKVYESLEKEVSVIESQIGETDACDDFQMLSFSILGLRSDLENACIEHSLSEEEADALTKEAMRLESVWLAKSAALGCASQDDTEELVTSEYDELD